MLYKLNASNPWVISLSLHGSLALLLLFAFGVSFLFQRIPPKTVSIQILETPKVVKAVPFAVTQKKVAEEKKSGRAVYGLSRNAVVAENPETPSVKVKQGNTLAKESDTLKLEKEDPNSLPAPVDEYLVSAMPQLASEVRINYPVEARKNGVQGAVVMDILIDDAGNVRDVKFIEGPGSGLNEAALEAVKGFQFKPALVDGKPVAVRIHYAYRFVLEK